MNWFYYLYFLFLCFAIYHGAKDEFESDRIFTGTLCIFSGAIAAYCVLCFAGIIEQSLHLVLFASLLFIGFSIDFCITHSDLERAKQNPDPELTVSQNKLTRRFGALVSAFTFIPAYAMGFIIAV